MCALFFYLTNPGNVYITLPPRNTTAVEGSRVRLQCQAEGHPDNITYRWYRDNVDVQLIPGFMQVSLSLSFAS